VCKVDCKDGFPSGRGRQVRDLRVTIPSHLIVVPTISNGHLFKCSYYIGVYLVMKVGGVLEKERLKCHIPIIISNMPLDRDAPPQMALPVPGGQQPLQRSQSHGNMESNFNAEMGRMMSDFQAILSASEAREDGGNNNNNGDGSGSNSGTSRVLERSGSSPAVISSSDYNPFTEPSNTGEPSSDTIDLTSDELPKSECIICYDGPKNMLVLPCAHIATCVNCTAHIMRTTKKCPVCRGAIIQVLRTYQV